MGILQLFQIILLLATEEPTSTTPPPKQPTMGNSGSQGQTNNKVTEVDNSSGLHIMELHAPSMGLMSILTIMLCILAFFIIRCCYKRYKTRQCCAPQLLPTYIPRPWQTTIPANLTPQEAISVINAQPQRTAIPMLDYNTKAPTF